MNNMVIFGIGTFKKVNGFWVSGDGQKFLLVANDDEDLIMIPA